MSKSQWLFYKRQDLANPEKKFLYISIFLFLFSLCFPIMIDQWDNNKEAFGIFALLFGWVLIFDQEWIGLVWLANFFIVFSWLCFKDIKSLISNLIALFLALLFTWHEEMPDYGWCGSFLDPIPCKNTKIVSVGFAYYLWLCSICILILHNMSRKYAVYWMYFQLTEDEK